MLLPHGIEGQGPEHSSARLERFLLLCAESNMQVVNLTTPAQLFHCLRRQVIRPWRKPLIVMSPKSLLRHRRAVSTMDELANGEFQRIIPDDPAIDPKKVKRVLLCSGKIYYDIGLERRERGRAATTSPSCESSSSTRSARAELQEKLAPYAADVDLVWVQEEPWNMGAWFFMRARLPEILGGRGLRFVASRGPRARARPPARGRRTSSNSRCCSNEVFAP